MMIVRAFPFYGVTLPSEKTVQQAPGKVKFWGAMARFLPTRERLAEGQSLVEQTKSPLPGVTGAQSSF